jgi:hypothetical protein
LREGVGLRQQAFRVEVRRRDLRAHERRIAIADVQLLRRDHRRARELPASHAQAPQLKIGNRPGVRDARIGRVRLHDPVDRALQRCRCCRQPQANGVERRIGLRREVRGDLVDLCDEPRRRAGVARRLAADQVVGRMPVVPS